MNPVLQARVDQLQAEAAYRRSVTEFREQRKADQQARINALLTEVVAALDQLPIMPDDPAAALLQPLECEPGAARVREAHARFLRLRRAGYAEADIPAEVRRLETRYRRDSRRQYRNRKADA